MKYGNFDLILIKTISNVCRIVCGWFCVNMLWLFFSFINFDKWSEFVVVFFFRMIESRRDSLFSEHNEDV